MSEGFIELIYSNGVTLQTGDAAFREVNPRKRLTRAERDAHEAARLIMDTLADTPTGKIVIFDREGKPRAVVVAEDRWARDVGWLG